MKIFLQKLQSLLLVLMIVIVSHNTVSANEQIKSVTSKSNIYLSQGQDTDDEFVSAIADDNADVVKKFLDKGADPNKHFSFAVSDGSIESMKLMLAKGADINRPDEYGITPLMEAARYAYRAGSKTTAFLLSKGAKVNVKTKKGNTALIFASSAAAKHYEDENVAVVKLLIGKGANFNVRNKAGKTALGIAREENWKKIAKVLRQAGAKL